MKELQDQIIAFYNLLSERNNSLALKSQWAIFFDIPIVMGGQGGSTGPYSAPNQTTLQELYLRENINGTVVADRNSVPWANLESVKRFIVGNNLIKTYGWLYASSVTIPGDSYRIDNYGDFVTGFPKGNIGKGRESFKTLNIDFYDTNASVTDYILRPWMILVAHNGLKIASVKSSVHVVPLMKRGSRSGGNVPRKVFSFFNCFPSMIGDEQLNFQGANAIEKNVQFTYDWYSVSNVSPGAFSVQTQQAGRM